MEKERRLADSKETQLLEGTHMLAFGAVALAYPGEALQTMLTAFGILLILNGLTRLLRSAWLFQRGSDWRRLMQWSGWVDLVLGAAALLAVVLDIPAAIELFTGWLLLSGFFHIRRYILLKDKWSSSRYLGISGFLSMLAGGLLASDAVLDWLPSSYPFSMIMVVLGISKILIFFKLGRMYRRLKKKAEQKPPAAALEAHPFLSRLEMNQAIE